MLHFKISLNGLIWKNHRDFTKEDILHILEMARKNNVHHYINNDVNRQFEGPWENLYCFMNDVCYRYDIELV